MPVVTPDRVTQLGAGSGRTSVRASALRVDGYLVFVGLVIALIAATLLDQLPRSILQDTWLALVAGREVAQHGIPHHVTLILFAQGRAWVDQQWLAQLCMYWLDRIGGVALVGLVNIALIAVSLAGAAIGSMRLGASARGIARVLPLAGIAVALTAEVRTQPYAYPLFVVTVYVLAADCRRSTRAVFWCLPVLVVWGNLHGSASLGAGLVALRGLSVLWERRRELVRGAAAWIAPLVLIVGAPLCLLVTPYGISMVSYYRVTLLDPALRNFITEWQPVTTMPVLAVVFFLLAAVTVWSFGRHPAGTTLWERAALLILAAGGIIAARNAVWFALTALMLLPLSINRAVRAWAPSQPRPALNLWLAGAAAVLVGVFVTRTFAISQAALEPTYPAAALAAVRQQRAANPAARVFADETYADWLLWRLPSLSGRVAYDASFELLSVRQLQRIFNFKAISGLSWPEAASGYRLVVLHASATPDLVRALRQQPGARVLYYRDDVAVIERASA